MYRLATVFWLASVRPPHRVCRVRRYFSRCGTPALDGVLAGVLAGVLDGAASSFYVFLLFIYPPNMVFIRNFPVFSRNIGERITQRKRFVSANV